MDERLPRKLAAILYADIADYSRLTGEDEDATHRRLSEYLDLVSNSIGQHQGKVVHYAGDAVLADFSTVTSALECATSIQSDLYSRNLDFPDDRKVQFRIGINLGEVIVDRDDIYGNGVNVAARLETLADAGGVCISDAVRTAIGNKLPLEYEFMGEQTVKNIKEPIRAYQVRLVSGEQPEESVPVLTELELPEEPSIAVLPFTNMSGDPEQEYFSDGITEDIITALSRISGLLVVARNSTMTYKGHAIDVKEVAHEQGVRYVLEGSVRKGGNRIRITAQLIDAKTGHHLWADRYDRDLADIFAVQDEITHMITVETQVKVTEGEQARLWAGGTNDVGAWERIFRATELKDNEIREDNIEGHRLTIEALKIDPQYARGWVVLGLLHWNDAFWGWTESREVSLAEASEAAQKAQQLEADFPDTLALQAHIYRLKGEHDRAVKAAQKAVTLSPNHSENTAMLAIILTCAGRAEEAVEKFKRAIRLCPVYPAWYLVLFGSCYYSMDDQDRAISTLKEAVAMEPDSAFARVWLCCALVEAGLIEDAREVAKEVLRIDPTFIATNYQGAIFKDPEIGKKIIENLLQAGIPR